MTFDKPIYLGFIVSEITKLQMLELYYDILQPHYGEEKLILHYMDTDSFIYTPQPKTGTIVGDLKDLQEKYNLYDFCKLKNYPELFCKDTQNLLN